jgi:hypothetical protein
MSQRTYEIQSDRPLMVGAPADCGRLDVGSFKNGNAVAQIDTMTIQNYVAAKELNWTIDGVPFSYTMTAGDANVTGVASSIVAQLNSEPLFSGLYHATSALGVITLTARIPGIGWTLVATGANAADNAIATTTANSAAGSLAFGKLVIPGTAEGKCRVAAATSMTAKVITATPANVATCTYDVAVKVGGHTYSTHTTSANPGVVKDTVEALAANLNALLPAASVAVTEDDAKLIFTAELAGLDFEVEVGSNNVAGTWTLTSNDGRATDIGRYAMGVSLRDDSIYSAVENSYPGNSVVSVLLSGRVVVDVEAAISANNPVYVRMADSANTGNPLGGFRSSAATDCIALPADKFRWVESLGNNQAVLLVNC